jgi:hypothetical protein
MSLKKICYVASISFHHLGEVDVSTQMDIRENFQSVVRSQQGGEE